VPHAHRRRPVRRPARVGRPRGITHARSSLRSSPAFAETAVLNGELASSLTDAPRWRSSPALAATLC
jgi:hypothetical protein